ncbi:shikimate dehydrogenase [Liquorilactobacillus sicerae]|uniref:shikimate dehydrogenase n=1 Tax=Liquorilactobacillus sicerae TaxID=1416943 RepID=UPI00248144E0|nr:shikimate dehydrogenase [Liquorilactobacillus sicerae]
MNFNGQTQLYGFLAHPAQHSLSPLMHNLSFQARQLNACYLAFDLKPADFDSSAANLKKFFAGFNLSMPYKKQIIPYLDELTPKAQRIMAVNTVKNQAGHLIGESTDGAGLFADLQAKGQKVAGKNLLILGAGGAGRAIIAAAADYQVKKVFVCKRPNQTFVVIKQWLQKIAQSTKTEYQLVDYSDQSALKQCLQQSQILINATNVGMDGQALPLTSAVLKQLSTEQFVYDIIYQPLKTPLLQLAAKRGCPHANGVGMLLWQGALAFEFWTGQTMPLLKVKTALLNEIRRRSS